MLKISRLRDRLDQLIACMSLVEIVLYVAGFICFHEVR